MDTSEQYIKMVDCPAIQDKRQRYVYGDWYYWKPNGDTYLNDSIGKDHSEEREKGLWLPTQADLQGLVWDKDSALHPIDMFRQFVKWMHSWQDYFYLDGLSPERCWLMYVMDRAYHKRWDGEKWVAV